MNKYYSTDVMKRMRELSDLTMQEAVIMPDCTDSLEISPEESTELLCLTSPMELPLPVPASQEGTISFYPHTMVYALSYDDRKLVKDLIPALYHDWGRVYFVPFGIARVGGIVTEVTNYIFTSLSDISFGYNNAIKTNSIENVDEAHPVLADIFNLSFSEFLQGQTMFNTFVKEDAELLEVPE